LRKKEANNIVVSYGHKDGSGDLFDIMNRPFLDNLLFFAILTCKYTTTYNGGRRL
jgi:hypothetical protein